MLDDTEVERLTWDSEFFGLNVARLLGRHLNHALAQKAFRWCYDQKIECLYFLADATDPETEHAAEDAGFRFVDLRCTYNCQLPIGAVPPNGVRLVCNDDLPALERLAAKSHRDTRFYRDRNFDPCAVDKLYARWIRRSTEGWADAVFVTGEPGEPSGYITCHLDTPDDGSIGLIAVDSAWRSHGLGRQLVSASLAHFSDRGVSRVKVVTQAKNLRAQQMYQRSGFILSQVEAWYHLWPEFPNTPGPYRPLREPQAC